MLKKLKKKVKKDNKVVETKVKKKIKKTKKVEPEIKVEKIQKKVKKEVPEVKVEKIQKKIKKEIPDSKIEKKIVKPKTESLDKDLLTVERNGVKYIDEKAMAEVIPGLANLFRKGSKLNGIPVRFLTAKEFTSGGWESICHYIVPDAGDSYSVIFEAKFYGNYTRKDVGLYFLNNKDVKICVRT